MAEVLSLQDVKNVMRDVFANAAGLADPMTITDDSKLYEAAPPAGNLALPRPPEPAMASLLTESSRSLMGAKVAALFPGSLVPPDMWASTTFGQLAQSVHQRVNELVKKAVLIAICRALKVNPDVAVKTAIKHPNLAGGLTFAHRLSTELAASVCTTGGFSLTSKQIADAAGDTTVGELIDAMAEIFATGDCL